MSEDADGKKKGKLHKVLGAGIGWVVAGPVGAALGLLVGYAVENNPQLLDGGLLGSVGNRLKGHYDVLQIPYDAGPEEVRLAYKRLAQKYHPDKFVDADPVVEELARGKMSEINEAYAAIMATMKKA